MRVITTILSLFMLVSLAGPAQAAAGKWYADDIVKMRLISASDTAGTSGELSLGLEVLLQDNWKTYWRTPGDAGLAPVVFLDPLSMAGATAQLSYPMPKRFRLFDLDTFGYSKHVIFPLTVTLSDLSQALQINMTAELLVCDDICVPVQAPLSLSLPMGAHTASLEAQELAKARSSVPRIEADSAHIALAPPHLDPENEGHLYVSIAAHHEVVDILIEGPAGLSFGTPEALGDGHYLIKKTAGTAVMAAQQALTATFDTTQSDFEVPLQLASAPAEIEASQGVAISSASLPMWLIALIGGFILNFMPCVLPVLSLKISHVLSMSQSSQSFVRTRFFMSASGILTSFMGLAAFLHLLRALGGQIGWGIQFQNPYFLFFMLMVTALFTISLFDIIQIRTPQFVSHLLPRHKQGAESVLWGDFGAGMLATLLATPCSAPFVGTAVGFALTQSSASLYGILFMMGVGLALPWLMVACFPGLIRYLPKPGAWMVRLKQGLGILMALTVLWLASLFVNAISYEGASSQEKAELSSPLSWQAFESAELANLRARDQIIFVDVTADWCITCQVNKSVVLNRQETARLFERYEVALRQADWTLPDKEIADYLASYQRYGIPFNILYGPGAKQGIILSEILTLSELEKALIQANQK